VTDREPPVPPPVGDQVAVALHDLDRVERQAGLVMQQLGVDRLVPLPVRLGADIDLGAGPR
jgi:hypothetical protein